jgi:Flavin containing amine oxidoreductase
VQNDAVNAGLAATRSLLAAGCGVAMLEARGRIGRRVWTNSFSRSAPRSRCLRGVRQSRWNLDPFARGSYAVARPGGAAMREALALLGRRPRHESDCNPEQNNH